MPAAVKIEGLRFTRGEGPDRFELRVPSLRIDPGRHTAIVGPSGCGKTTLLRLATGILLPDAGSCEIDGVRVDRQSDRDRRGMRARKVGMVFQQFALLDYLSALDNILLPARIAPGPGATAEVRRRARDLARDCGIAGVLARKPAKLSQGERQRVAICRALVMRPMLIVCDEPTGNLDARRSGEVIDLILSEARAVDATVVAVTHDTGIVGRFEGVFDLSAAPADRARVAVGATA
ncbi:MAG: ATP-binding cassette domain-containing protein [Planctomycetota bacterium]